MSKTPLIISDDLPDEDKKIYALAQIADRQEELRREEEKRLRLSRQDDSRRNNTRDLEQRPSYHASFRGQLDILPSIFEKMDPEYQYCWLREKIYNQPDEDSVSLAIQNGFRPVLSSEIPELGTPKEVLQALGRKASNIIRVNSMMLVKKLKSHYKEDFENSNSRFTNSTKIEEHVNKLDALMGYGPFQRNKFETRETYSNRLNERF